MSSSSLYGNVGNVTVSSKNLTTLYNATTGNTVVANVPDRNFTTLYAAAGQTNITPTRAYGNSNVEAFLNAGTDGANVVHNINMNGQLTVGGQSYLGNVGNVYITGGNSGYVLTTNGVGNLIWAEPQGGGGSETEYIHFAVTTNGNNQTFTDTLLTNYANANVMNLFKNGVNIEPEFYEKTADDTVQVNIPLASGDTIDVLASGGGGGGGLPAGIPESVQFNTGYEFGGDSFFLYNSTTHTLSIPTVVGNLEGAADVAYSVDVANVVGIGNIATIDLDGSGSNVLYGNGVFAPGGGGGSPAGTNTSIQFNGDSSFAGDDYFTYVYDGGSSLSTLNLGYTGILSSGAVLSLNGRLGNTQFTQTGVNGGLTIDVNGSNSILTINATKTNLGANSNVKITGGSTGQVLSTDGAGNLSWTTTSGSPGGANTQIQYNNSGSFAGSSAFTFNNSSNVVTMSDANVATLNATGDFSLQRAFEKVNVVSSGFAGTINFYVDDQSILYYSDIATANCIINVSSTSIETLDAILPVNKSLTIVFIGTVGSSVYINSSLQIDGIAQTINWAGGISPTTGSRLTYAKQNYTYTILKTGTSTYTVFGTLTEFA